MKNIQIDVLNPDVLHNAEQMMVCAARLTQRGHKIKNLDDFLALYRKPYMAKTASEMANLPHPTIQKFGVINVVVVGASRRFLAQITRHQNEVKFMSASLQYSDYSGEADFVVPYEITESGEIAAKAYLERCQSSMYLYGGLVNFGINNDAAGYVAPQGLRNALIISATPYQWRHMISQRTCRRNTSETRYVLLKIWEMLYNFCPTLFGQTGPDCMYGSCKEGRMSCGRPMAKQKSPTEILHTDFQLLYKEGTNEG